MNPRRQESLHLKFKQKKFTRICLTFSFLLVTPKPNSVVAAKYFTR